MFSDFTYADLRRIYDRARGARTCLTFGELENGAVAPSRYILIRHDLDYSLDKAVELARRERDWGYRATYFVLPSCDHYNLLSGPGGKAVRELGELGHEVGLHYDVQVMAGRRSEDMLGQLKFELGVLSDLCGREVRSIAMHNPSVYGDDPFDNVDFVVNAYRPDLIDEGGYFSDSAGAWRDHAVEAIGRDALPDRLQLLIHPMLWGEAPGRRLARLEAWQNDIRDNLRQSAKRVSALWSAHSGVREHEAREAGERSRAGS